jgi:hypothetical protein
MELPLETGCFYEVSAEELTWRKLRWSSQLCMGVCKERTWARDVEESPLLEAVKSERLVKTRQAEKV